MASATPVDSYQPDRFDAVGAAICLVGVVTIMYGADIAAAEVPGAARPRC